jgi:putative redox protein
MSAQKPPTLVELSWKHDLVFSGTSGSINLVLDSASVEGPSPMQALAFGLAACMAMDVVHVITKGRFNLRGLRASLVGQRAPEEPRRFTSIALHYAIEGEVPADKVERAIALSREKYCSVWHSMRHDIDLNVTYQVISG